MLLRAITLLGLSAIGLNAYAASADFNLHNNALRLTYASGVSNQKGLEVDAGMLYHDSGDEAYHLGANVTGENWSDAGTFDISLGGRAFFVPGTGYDALAFGVGGQLRFSPVHRLGVGGHIYYAPGILSFLDSDGYTEVAVRLDYQVLPQAFVYVGHRSIKMDVDINGNKVKGVELDKDVHIGMKLLF